MSGEVKEMVNRSGGRWEKPERVQANYSRERARPERERVKLKGEHMKLARELGKLGKLHYKVILSSSPCFALL